MANSNAQPTTNVATNNTPIPSATQVGGADIGFLNGAKYASTGSKLTPASPTAQVPAPTTGQSPKPTTVFTSSLAADQAKADQQKLIATQTAYNAGKALPDNGKPNQTTEQPAVKIYNPAESNPSILDGVNPDIANNPIYKGLVSLVGQSISSLDKTLADTNSLIDAQISKLDTNQINTANAIKMSAKKRYDAMVKLNEAALAGATQAGIVAGRNRYTPEIENAELRDIEVKGQERLKEIDAEEQVALKEATDAADEKKFTLLNQKMNSVKDIQAKKQDILTELYKNSITLEQNAYQRQKDKEAAEALKQKEFNDFAKEHDLYMPFYAYEGGGEVYDSRTGTKLTNDQYKALSVSGDEQDIQFLSSTAKKANAKDSTFVGKIGEYTDEMGNKHDIIGTYNYETGQVTPFNSNIKNVPGGDVIETTPKVQTYLSAVDRLQGKLTDKDFFALKRNVSGAIERGDFETAKTLIQQNTLDAMPAATRTAYINGDVALATISKIKADLQRYQQMGGDTGILSSTREEIMRKLGRSTNPELLKIGVEINDLFFRLRNEMTGAAFSPEESSNYAQQLPELKNQYGVNITLANAYEDLLKTKREAQLRSQMGSQFYDNIFGTMAATQSILDAIKSNPELRTQIDNMKADNLTDDEILQVIGPTVQQGPQINAGTLPGVKWLNGGGLNVTGGSGSQPQPQNDDWLNRLRSDPEFSVNNKKIMRTDRHFNPAAFTTDIAKLAGLKVGVDYLEGDTFSNGRYKTAKLLGDPVATTIKVIDNIGFKTQRGSNRWTYTNSIPGANNAAWSNLSYDQKKNVIAKMYQHEGGSKLKGLFT